ncbi:MAG: ABC transporter ATP-binding protein [Phycisphaerales bacterium]|nr:ABC transporter ATP-binding protein [Phycisphaerales bacterium]
MEKFSRKPIGERSSFWYSRGMVTIDIEHVTKRFTPTSIAVDRVSLQIPSGSLFFLLGPSGCGKTTLLRMIAGFVLPNEGKILFDQQDITNVPPHLRETGMVFQSYALWPHMTVADNVAFGLDTRKIRNPERARQIDEALALVQMSHLKDRKPNQLSGGQQQRVALARALAFRPKCLLLDEPLSNLDAKLRLEMRSEIRRIVKQTGITAIYVTHDQKEALSMADRIAVMKLGQLQQIGTPAELYRQPRSRFVADFIGESNFLDATVESVDGGVVKVNTPIGQLSAHLPQQSNSIVPGKKMLTAFRPESVTLQGHRQDADATTNILPGKRISTTYLGEIAEHVVELANGQRVKAFELNPEDGGGGTLKRELREAVTLQVAPQNLMLVEAD